jgi:hypothetical protein
VETQQRLRASYSSVLFQSSTVRSEYSLLLLPSNLQASTSKLSSQDQLYNKWKEGINNERGIKNTISMAQILPALGHPSNKYLPPRNASLPSKKPVSPFPHTLRWLIFSSSSCIPCLLQRSRCQRKQCPIAPTRLCKEQRGKCRTVGTKIQSQVVEASWPSNRKARNHLRCSFLHWKWWRTGNESKHFTLR